MSQTPSPTSPDALSLHWGKGGSLLSGPDLSSVHLAISPASLAGSLWGPGLPTPLQIEQAIDEVEATIEGAGLRHALRGELLLTGDVPSGLSALLGPGTVLDRNTLEDRFTQLASRAYTASRGEAPGAGAAEWGGEAAAALLTVRELMHHLGFTSLRWDA